MNAQERCVMQQALEALEPLSAYGRVGSRDVEQAAAQVAIATLRKTLAEPVVGPVTEPVGYASIEGLRQLQNCNGMSVWCESPSMWGPKEQAPPAPENLVAIYTAPRPMHFQEPVAWAHDRFIENDDGMRIGTDEPELQWGKYVPDDDGGWFPLYSSPPPPADVPMLTPGEVALMWIGESFDTMSHESCYVRGVKRGEQAVRQKAGIK